jgi:hypothetical protein
METIVPSTIVSDRRGLRPRNTRGWREVVPGRLRGQSTNFVAAGELGSGGEGPMAGVGGLGAGCPGRFAAVAHQTKARCQPPGTFECETGRHLDETSLKSRFRTWPINQRASAGVDKRLLEVVG